MTTRAEEPLQIGTVVHDRYRIAAIVGRGGVGTVYKVSDVRYGNTYALKELADQSSGARKQFENEAQWLHGLDHDSIPKVREYFEWESRLYLVMDFVEGENLEHKLSRLGGRPLPEAQVLAWILPICGALQYLHERQPPILHRDVKPANIIIMPNGHPVLVDLGIAKEHLPGAGLTATFVRKAGTEGYAPPEQYTTAGKTGPWSDVYGLGATLYELLTGQVPPTAVERVALDSPMVRPRTLNPAINPRVDEVVTRALAIRPADRFQSVAQLIQALQVAQRSSNPSLAGTGPIPSAAAPMPVIPPRTRPSGPQPSPPGSPPVSAPFSAPPFSIPPSAPSGGLTLPHLDVPGSSLTSSYANPGSAPSPLASAPQGYNGSYAAPENGRATRTTTRRNRGSVLVDETPTAVPGSEKRKRRAGSWLLVTGGVLGLLVLLAGAYAIYALGIFNPPDRSSPQVTVTGYFAALQSGDYTRAWQYSADSHNDLTSEPGYVGGLNADEQHLGRVLSARLVSVTQDTNGSARVQVSAKRAKSPDTPITYTLALTQYGGTWLITSISIL
jgi:serine/threonine protein kinase